MGEIKATTQNTYPTEPLVIYHLSPLKVDCIGLTIINTGGTNALTYRVSGYESLLADYQKELPASYILDEDDGVILYEANLGPNGAVNLEIDKHWSALDINVKDATAGNHTTVSVHTSLKEMG